jgi:predicted DNA-binding transcriptional regulator AlpA
MEIETEIDKKCLAEDRTLSVRMLEEMTGINKDTVYKIILEDVKEKKCVLVWFLIC